MKRFDHIQGESASTINRRTVLKGVGAMGVAGFIGTGTVAGKRAGEAVCDCPTETVAWGKFEFQGCEFVFEKGENFEGDGGPLVEITDWESKAGEECEPVTVNYDVADGYEVIHICAFGGNATDDDAEPDGTYESDLENKGGRRAAISHLTFCVGEAERFPGYQIDLIHGDPIEQFDPANGVTYNEQERLMQSYWSGQGLDTGDFVRSDSDYAHCFDTDDHEKAIPQSIEVTDGTATACVKPDDADCLDDFALVSYGAPGDSWDPATAPQQVLWDVDTTGEVDEEGGTVCFSVELPPLEE